MSRRGRPPHPDILTPREWEVLALLREGLRDEAIAERLGLSIHGAKYHVREILSKLGVPSRQEAAAWQPEERAPARRWLALPLAARTGAALVIVAAVAGLGVLAWGVVRTSDEAGGEDALDLPAPGSSLELNPDEALLRAAKFVGGDIREVEGGATTWAAAKAAAGDTGFGPDDPRDDAATWFFRFSATSRLDAGSFGPVGPPTPNATAVVSDCIGLAVWFPDIASERGPQMVTVSGLPADCSGSAPATRLLAVALAATATDIFWSGDDPPAPEAEQMILTRALEAVRDRGAQQTSLVTDLQPDTPVWLVTLAGRFFEPEGLAPEGGTPRPTTVVSCADRFVILDVASHEVIFGTRSPNDACD